MQIYWNKGCFYIRKEVNFQRNGLEQQHGPLFIVLEHQYGRRDVILKGSKIEGLRIQYILLGN